MKKDIVSLSRISPRVKCLKKGQPQSGIASIADMCMKDRKPPQNVLPAGIRGRITNYWLKIIKKAFYGKIDLSGSPRVFRGLFCVRMERLDHFSARAEVLEPAQFVVLDSERKIP